MKTECETCCGLGLIHNEEWRECTKSASQCCGGCGTEIECPDCGGTGEVGEENTNSPFYTLITIIFLLCLTGSYYSQTVDSVKAYLKTTDLQHQDIILKQSILETGWYKSHSCKERKNLFGFRYKGKYLEFDTWQESIHYYIGWQKRHYKKGDYYDFLNEIGYATDTEYINKLKQIKI